MKVILQSNGKDLIGSDSLMWVDGRKTVSNIAGDILERNRQLQKNFPHKTATSFYIVDDRLNARSGVYKLNN